jgi:DNA-binding transcriptional ArsR family regulator
MSNNSKLDYLAKHERIRDKLIELSKTSEHACFNVARLASDLKMDIRTVRGHLKIMELDAVGTFMDDEQKQFCTKKGIALLADTLRANEK